LFVSKLYFNITLSLLLAHEIIQYISNSYKLSIEIIKHKYENRENKENIACDIKDMCINLQKTFDQFSFKIEHQTLHYFIRHNYLTMPQSVHIDRTLNPKRLKMHRSNHNQMLQIISLRPLLTKLLQLPNIFHTIMKHIRESKSNNILTSIFDGKV